MDVDAVPALTDEHEAAVRRALDVAGIRLDASPTAYMSPWRRAGSVDAEDDELLPTRYALSPRSTRGATRA